MAQQGTVTVEFPNVQQAPVETLPEQPEEGFANVHDWAKTAGEYEHPEDVYVNVNDWLQQTSTKPQEQEKNIELPQGTFGKASVDTFFAEMNRAKEQGDNKKAEEMKKIWEEGMDDMSKRLFQMTPGTPETPPKGKRMPAEEASITPKDSVSQYLSEIEPDFLNKAIEELRSLNPSKQGQFEWAKNLEKNAPNFHKFLVQGMDYALMAGPAAKGFPAAKAGGRVYMGHEAKPKFEISDQNMSWTKNVRQGIDIADLGSGRVTGFMYKGNRLYQAIDHPELFKNYPEAKNIKVVPDLNLPQGEGHFKDNTITISAVDFGTPEGLKSIAHEIQHWIQVKEGFAKGGSYKGVISHNIMVIKKLRSIGRHHVEYDINDVKQAIDDAPTGNSFIDALHTALQREDKGYTGKNFDDALARLLETDFNQKQTEDIATSISFELYKRLSGEVEARNVSKRLKMTEEERIANPPHTTEDIDLKAQTIATVDDALKAIEVMSSKGPPKLEVVARGERGPTPRLTPEQEMDIAKTIQSGGLIDVGLWLNKLDEITPRQNPLSKEATRYAELQRKLIEKEDLLYSQGKTYEVKDFEQKLINAGITEDHPAFKMAKSLSNLIDEARDTLLQSGITPKRQKDLKKEIRQRQAGLNDFVNMWTSGNIDLKTGMIKETPEQRAAMDASWERFKKELIKEVDAEMRPDLKAIEGGLSIRNRLAEERVGIRKEADRLRNMKGHDPEELRLLTVLDNQLLRTLQISKAAAKAEAVNRGAGRTTDTHMLDMVETQYYFTEKARLALEDYRGGTPRSIGAGATPKDLINFERKSGQRMSEQEIQHTYDVLDKYNGSTREAAQELGITQPALTDRLTTYPRIVTPEGETKIVMGSKTRQGKIPVQKVPGQQSTKFTPDLIKELRQGIAEGKTAAELAVELRSDNPRFSNTKLRSLVDYIKKLTTEKEPQPLGAGRTPPENKPVESLSLNELYMEHERIYLRLGELMQASGERDTPAPKFTKEYNILNERFLEIQRQINKKEPKDLGAARTPKELIHFEKTVPEETPAPKTTYTKRLNTIIKKLDKGQNPYEIADAFREAYPDNKASLSTILRIIEQQRESKGVSEGSDRRVTSLEHSEFTPNMREYIKSIDRVGEGQVRLPRKVLFREFLKAFPGRNFDMASFNGLVNRLRTEQTKAKQDTVEFLTKPSIRQVLRELDASGQTPEQIAETIKKTWDYPEINAKMISNILGGKPSPNRGDVGAARTPPEDIHYLTADEMAHNQRLINLYKNEIKMWNEHLEARVRMLDNILKDPRAKPEVPDKIRNDIVRLNRNINEAKKNLLDIQKLNSEQKGRTLQ